MVMSMLNLGSFFFIKIYGGYFDLNKCYKYDSSGIILVDMFVFKMKDLVSVVGYFVFDSVSSVLFVMCSGFWSGNYFNWVVIQMIDIFRLVMIGGYCVVDILVKIVFEKVCYIGQMDMGFLDILGVLVISNVIFLFFKYFFIKLNGFGNKMYFVFVDINFGMKCDKNGRNCFLIILWDVFNNFKGVVNKGVDGYMGQDIKFGYVYLVNIDVFVCKSGLFELNCVKYGSNYKFEGLI